ncbi:Ganglioside-induced differentiation-associated protein 1 [Saguinus oedipus]|uniref:Ganglioside-induced differentiation-associated protein 1 n=1 Tax=Saguinus oedipus TaxID=9490 RepID=A0ABQ9UEW7_SAGOE|nr:Ganglioside-induced differentiation-associated protein 1 [Saguinus oedipus]
MHTLKAETTDASWSLYKEGHQPWLCGESFTLADVSLAVTLHRLKFLGFARRNWGNGKRPNLETYYERVLKRKTFNKVLGHVNNILISAVLPTAFRVAKKRAPKVLGTTLVVENLDELYVPVKIKDHGLE